MLQLSSGRKSKYSVETSNLKLASENSPFHLCRSQLRSHLFGNYAFWRYTYIPKLCHRYSQVAGEDSIELGGKRTENLESVCAVEGCGLIFPRLRSPIPINALPDCKGHFTGLDSLLQLANVVAGFSQTLLLFMVAAGSYANQVSG